MTKRIILMFGLASTVGAMGCGEDSSTTAGNDAGSTTFTTTEGMDETMADSTGVEEGTGSSTTAGDGDGDGTGDGDGDTTGDGDGDSTTGDGDGDSTTGDGDGDSTTGDGDGDTTGDGDGDTTGDGDGDTTGDGDGDTTGDGDGDTSTTGTTSTTGGTDCQAPPSYVDCDGTPGVDFVTDPFQAIGLNCPGGTAANSIQVNNATMNSINSDAWRIATSFGVAPGSNYNGFLWAANQDPWTSPNMEEIDPNTSSAILILSTGVVAGADPVTGAVVEGASSQGGNGDNMNEDNGGLPAPLSAAYGSNNGMGGDPFNNCDGVNDCSDSLYDHWFTNGWNNPNDKLWMSFDVDVPAGTFGYVFDFAYFSSEWPGFINTQYNDLFIAWQVSEVYTGNVTFVNDAPLTITSLDSAGAFAYTNTAPELAGTGFEGNAGTGWFTARGAVNENETAGITFFIADMADSILATGVLLDNFRWECEGCIPSEIDDCGLTPLPE